LCGEKYQILLSNPFPPPPPTLINNIMLPKSNILLTYPNQTKTNPPTQRVFPPSVPPPPLNQTKSVPDGFTQFGRTHWTNWYSCANLIWQTFSSLDYGTWNWTHIGNKTWFWPEKSEPIHIRWSSMYQGWRCYGLLWWSEKMVTLQLPRLFNILPINQ